MVALHTAKARRLPVRSVDEVELEVVRILAPCRILTSGTVRIGDAVTITDPPAEG